MNLYIMIGILCIDSILFYSILLSRGGDFDDLYPDVSVEGLKKDPF